MAIGPFITIVSFLYSWVTAWTNLILVAGEAAAGSLNPHVLLPLTVLLLGLVMTNTLGFLEFYRDKRMKMAGIAAVDLDTPYILYTARQESRLAQICVSRKAVALSVKSSLAKVGSRALPGKCDDCPLRL
eukprot:Skav212395  [mRNA]  locus=scaffold2663:13717:14387:+ [translate_table: standard]